MKQNVTLSLIAALLLSLFQASAQNTSPYWSLSGNSNASATAKLGTTNSIPLRFLTKNAERLRIDTLGRIGIGLIKPGAKLSVLNSGSTPGTAWGGSILPLFQGFAENTSGTADYIVSMASNTASARTVFIGKRSRGTLAAPTLVSNNDYLLTLRSSGYDGKAFHNNAAIEFVVDGTPAAGSVPARIAFATGSTGGNRVDRLVIGSTGNIAFNSNQLFVQKSTGAVGIGTAAPASGRKLHVEGKSSFINLPSDIEYGGSPNDKDFGITIKSISGGLYAESVPEDFNDSPYGVGIGIQGRGNTGVEGTGFIGVRGTGYARDGSATGVYGYGGVGVKGESSEGVGVFGISTSSVGIGGQFVSEGGIGVYATSGSADGDLPYAGYFEGNVYSTGNYYPSDGKLKQNITGLNGAMALLSKLQPKEYEYKQDGTYTLMRLPQGKRYGLIAEELEKVLPGLVKKTTFDSRLVQKQDSTTKEANLGEKIEFKAVNYSELIPIMIKGMQEQEAENNELKKQVLNQQEQITELRQMLLDLKNGSKGTITHTGAFLEQNTPNPVTGTTVIRYQVPEASNSARLTLTNSKGQVVKEIVLSSRGTGQISISTTSLAAGTYNYVLYVDGKRMDSKRLLIAR